MHDVCKFSRGSSYKVLGLPAVLRPLLFVSSLLAGKMKLVLVCKYMLQSHFHSADYLSGRAPCFSCLTTTVVASRSTGNCIAEKEKLPGAAFVSVSSSSSLSTLEHVATYIYFPSLTDIEGHWREMTYVANVFLPARPGASNFWTKGGHTLRWPQTPCGCHLWSPPQLLGQLSFPQLCGLCK